MSQGTIVQCIGAVIDVEFPRDQMPKIYDALKMDDIGLTLEVEQQLGDGERQDRVTEVFEPLIVVGPRAAVCQRAVQQPGVRNRAAKAFLQPVTRRIHQARGAAQRAATSTVLSNSRRKEMLDTSGTVSS